jgi:hypothetical protein
VRCSGTEARRLWRLGPYTRCHRELHKTLVREPPDERRRSSPVRREPHEYVLANPTAERCRHELLELGGVVAFTDQPGCGRFDRDIHRISPVGAGGKVEEARPPLDQPIRVVRARSAGALDGEPAARVRPRRCSANVRWGRPGPPRWRSAGPGSPIVRRERRHKRFERLQTPDRFADVARAAARQLPDCVVPRRTWRRSRR